MALGTFGRLSARGGDQDQRDGIEEDGSGDELPTGTNEVAYNTV